MSPSISKPPIVTAAAGLPGVTNGAVATHRITAVEIRMARAECER